MNKIIISDPTIITINGQKVNFDPGVKLLVGDSIKEQTEEQKPKSLLDEVNSILNKEELSDDDKLKLKDMLEQFKKDMIKTKYFLTKSIQKYSALVVVDVGDNEKSEANIKQQIMQLKEKIKKLSSYFEKIKKYVYLVNNKLNNVDSTHNALRIIELIKKSSEQVRKQKEASLDMIKREKSDDLGKLELTKEKLTDARSDLEQLQDNIVPTEDGKYQYIDDGETRILDSESYDNLLDNKLQEIEDLESEIKELEGNVQPEEEYDDLIDDLDYDESGGLLHRKIDATEAEEESIKSMVHGDQDDPWGINDLGPADIEYLPIVAQKLNDIYDTNGNAFITKDMSKEIIDMVA